MSLRWWVRRRGVRGCPDCDALHLIVADESRKGHFVLLHAHDPAGRELAITPRFIANIADLAQKLGWSPGEGPDEPFPHEVGLDSYAEWCLANPPAVDEPTA